VLDIGSAGGSFDETLLPLHVVRVDLGAPPSPPANFVRADAAKLPFRTGCFDGLVSNHSLEHFAGVESCLREMGRVLKPGGFLFIAVPDASTVTDRLYRWLSRGGGHINPFRSPREVIQLVESTTGIAHVATRTLCTSLSFLNRRKGPWPRRVYLVGGGYESSLRVLTYSFRLLDRWFGTRARIYGWAFYFGASPDHEECWSNVCVRCGSGQSSAWLLAAGRVRKGRFGFRRYSCSNCEAVNLFTDDEA
jgi:SAM-dependent methyltransferase